MIFTLPSLPYSFAALEPHIDARTMEIHHGKHHNAYVTNLNKALEGGQVNGDDLSIEFICKHISKYPVAVRNNGGGHYNHSLFWKSISPSGGGEPQGELSKAIKEVFGSFEGLKEKFNAAALGRFGSGWAWIIKNKNNGLEVTSTPNQDNPLMDVVESQGNPILGLDVWEHAYYLHYQNRRADYCSAFWNVVDWAEVEKRWKMT